MSDKLESLRAQQADFKGLSFDTISGSGPNGAIIHYKPERETCAIVRRDQMYLCDSGGQYMWVNTQTLFQSTTVISTAIADKRETHLGMVPPM